MSSKFANESGSVVSSHELIMDDDPTILESRLWSEIDRAIHRVRRFHAATPCDRIALPGSGEILLKREDLSPVHSYKWRGACNKIGWLLGQGQAGSLVTASAGNHAQGVALAAAQARTAVQVFMPVTTPILKQEAVRRLGGEFVSINLIGDYYDDAAAAAQEFLKKNGGTYLHPFDDLQVIAGQATIALELDDDCRPDLAILQIGGGGMAAGVATVLKKRFPGIKVVGVEVVGQNSMQVSFRARRRCTLAKVSHFCDGTAVSTPGSLTSQICFEMLDDIWTVNEQEVCAAIEWLWNEKRIVVEPSAAIGVAAALAIGHAANINNPEIDAALIRMDLPESPTILTVLSGSNVDFLTLGTIARKGRHADKQRRFYSFRIEERSGTLIQLLDQFLPEMNIVDFQYGKTDPDKAFPVIGIDALMEELDCFEQRMKESGIPFRAVSNQIGVEYRLVPFQPALAKHTLFATIDFPDRPGALSEFMRQLAGKTNLCYFNYCQNGQEITQALMGFEFANPDERERFRNFLSESEFATPSISDSFGSYWLSEDGFDKAV